MAIQNWCVAVFPGQGSQVPGMAGELCAASATARATYAEASEVLGYDLVAACDDRHGRGDLTVVVQPAMVTHSVACWRIAREEYGLEPGLFAGHSVGEITALVCAEALDFPRAVDLARHRAEAMAAVGDRGAMMAVFGLAATAIAGFCAEVSSADRPVAVGLRNLPDQTVVTGDRDAVREVGLRCERAGGVVQHLRVRMAGHSELNRPVVEPFAERLRAAAPRDPCRPVISGFDGRLCRTAAEVTESLIAQVCGPVDWIAVAAAIKASGGVVVVELGSKAVLTRLFRHLLPSVRALPAGTPDELRRLRGPLAAYTASDSGGLVTREAAARFTAALLRRVVGTPARVELAAAEFQQRIRRPYARLLERADALREQRGAPAGDGEPVGASEVAEAGALASRVLAAKGFAPDQASAWLESCAADAGIAPRLVSATGQAADD